MKVETEDLAAAREMLTRWFPKGSTVYTILRSVSRTGMTRVIGVVSLRATPVQHMAGHPSADYEVSVAHPNYYASLLTGYKLMERDDGLKLHGAGMDMGFELAYTLSRELYGDGYALNHKWL
jgi:hypothetical protein